MLEYVTSHDGPPGFSRWDFAGASRDNTDHGRLYAEAVFSAGQTSVAALDGLLGHDRKSADFCIGAAQSKGLQ